MYGINYSHQWSIPLPKKEVWTLVGHAFVNSGEIAQWPHEFIDIRSGQQDLSKGTDLWFTYKFGNYKKQLSYVIRQIIPQQRIVYEAAKDHPLEGTSEVSLEDDIDKPGFTKIKWSGRYDLKSFSSAVSLLFFKFYFDPKFFTDLEHATFKVRALKKSKHTLSLVA